MDGPQYDWESIEHSPEFQELDDSLAAELKDSCGYRHLLLHINADNTLTLPTRLDSAELRGR